MTQPTIDTTGTRPDATTEQKEQAGAADAEKLAQKWVKGEGNTKSGNFTTPGDKANPDDFEAVLAREGEPSYLHPERGPKAR